ncbi:MAG: hypothetical protein INR64_13635 [Caulobacteraceae bacterium]|nr:hypothetical protein [Caulobacter sp.]
MSSRLGRLRAALNAGWSLPHILLAAAVLLIPTAVNGRPGMFFDTLDYLHSGEAAWRLLGVTLPGLDLTPPTEQARQQLQVMQGMASSRSAAYGGVVYPLWRLGGLWLVSAVQACAAAAIVYAFVRAACGRRERLAYGGVVAGLTLVSSLPFYCGFAMPDVSAGLAAVSLTTLAVYPGALPRAARRALFAIATLALCMHTSNVLLAIALVAVAALVGGWLARRPWGAVRSAAWTASAVALSLGLFVAYGAVVRQATGKPLGTPPPFLTARVLQDGPGREYLQWSCDHGGRWALCAYRTRRLTSVDDILWSRDPHKGIYGAVSPAERQRLAAQDRAFAIASTLHDPLGQAAASARNAALTRGALGLREPLEGPFKYLRDGFWVHTAMPWIMPGAAKCDADIAACRPRLGFTDMRVIDTTAMVAAVAFLLWRLTRRDVRAALRSPGRELTVEGRFVAAALLLVAVVLINATVCGVISGPYARYQARVAWVVPLAALTLWARLGWRAPWREA